MWHGAADVTLYAKLLIYFKYTKFLQFEGIILVIFRNYTLFIHIRSKRLHDDVLHISKNR